MKSIVVLWPGIMHIFVRIMNIKLQHVYINAWFTN